VIAILPKFSVQQNNTNIYVFHCSAGQGLEKHEHPYSHLTFCTAGSIIVRKENLQHIMTKDSQPVNLKAKEWHEIEALEDGTVFINVFAENTF